MPIRASALAALTVLTTSPLYAQEAQDVFQPMPDSLAEHQWEHRPVLIFADRADDASLISAQQAIENAAEDVAARDIVVMIDAAPEAEGGLRERFKPEGFTMILVGKDGTEKLRDSGPISVTRLFETIDAMPMRQQEMKDG